MYFDYDEDNDCNSPRSYGHNKVCNLPPVSMSKQNVPRNIFCKHSTFNGKYTCKTDM